MSTIKAKITVLEPKAPGVGESPIWRVRRAESGIGSRVPKSVAELRAAPSSGTSEVKIAADGGVGPTEEARCVREGGVEGVSVDCAGQAGTCCRICLLQ